MQMPVFKFCIQPDGNVSKLVFPDVEAARQEARGAFTDFARNIATSVEADAPWSIEVLSEDGALLYRIKVIAEAL
jgi:hypothetical protein